MGLSDQARDGEEWRIGFAPQRHVILVIAVDPSGTSWFAHDIEGAEIAREIRMTNGRDYFELRRGRGAGVDEMMRDLNEHQPTIIHFRGHSGVSVRDAERPPTLPHREVDLADAAIQLVGARQQPQHVLAPALTAMIASAAPTVRVVVLNACYSETVAEALCRRVDCVVGMPSAIGDDAARSFAVCFYRALGYRRSVGNAVEQADAALAAQGLQRPICRTRTGISADEIVLTGLDRRT